MDIVQNDKGPVGLSGLSRASRRKKMRKIGEKNKKLRLSTEATSNALVSSNTGFK